MNECIDRQITYSREISASEFEVSLTIPPIIADLNFKHLEIMASVKTNDLNLPDYDDLPPVEGMPKGCAWGLFDKDGKKDLFGTLNLLTPSVVKAAGAEIQDGVSISLK